MSVQRSATVEREVARMTEQAFVIAAVASAALDALPEPQRPALASVLVDLRAASVCGGCRQYVFIGEDCPCGSERRVAHPTRTVVGRSLKKRAALRTPSARDLNALWRRSA